VVHEKNSVTKKTTISDQMDDDLRRFVREHGFASDSDCIRELLRLALYGSEHVMNLHRQRLDALAQNLAANPSRGGTQ
jgi:Arc/MetJ-type ribon-helix-helix transcriptional regulator